MGKRKLPAGTWLEREMVLSPAYISLRGAAPIVLMIFLHKRHMKQAGANGHKKWICTNKDSLSFTYKEARSYGIGVSKFATALDNLLARGFISLKHQGGTYHHDKSVYSLSENWRIWQPGMIFETRPTDTIKRGFQNGKKTKLASKSRGLHTSENRDLNSN